MYKARALKCNRRPQQDPTLQQVLLLEDQAVNIQKASESLPPELFFQVFHNFTGEGLIELQPTRIVQPSLSRSNGSHPQQEGTNLGVFIPIWLLLNRHEAINLGVFDLCHFHLLGWGSANSGGFGAR